VKEKRNSGDNSFSFMRKSLVSLFFLGRMRERYFSARHNRLLFHFIAGIVRFEIASSPHTPFFFCGRTSFCLLFFFLRKVEDSFPLPGLTTPYSPSLFPWLSLGEECRASRFPFPLYFPPPLPLFNIENSSPLSFLCLLRFLPCKKRRPFLPSCNGAPSFSLPFLW